MNSNVSPVDIDNLLDCAAAVGRRRRAEARQRAALAGRLTRLHRAKSMAFLLFLVVGTSFMVQAYTPAPNGYDMRTLAPRERVLSDIDQILFMS